MGGIRGCNGQATDHSMSAAIEQNRVRHMKTIKCGLVGYGPAFRMGRHHADAINSTAGMATVAVCDVSPERLEVAQEELPGVATYTKLDDMLAESDLDLAVIITPHNTHADLAVACMNAGRHVVVEKPMCVSVQQAKAMLQAAQANSVMLSVYHNRRWDGDYMTIRRVVEEGLVGEVFEVDCYMGNWTPPDGTWRSDKQISGGAFFDWGAHLLDWVLQLVDRPILDVTGFFHKRVWMQMTNEDQVRAIIRFEGNVQADVTISSIARARRSKWRILGDRGSIELPHGAEALTVATELGGLETRMQMPFLPPARERYYQNIADHLLRRAELVCKPEQAALAIAVMEAAERSARSGKPQKLGL